MDKKGAQKWGNIRIPHSLIKDAKRHVEQTGEFPSVSHMTVYVLRSFLDTKKSRVTQRE